MAASSIADPRGVLEDLLLLRSCVAYPGCCHDHRIHLTPGSPPVAVQPYRYPQLLKDER
jgi:hypothetical protein